MQTISGGVTVTVSSGTETGDTVLNGGTLTIDPGASAVGTQLSGGFEFDSGTTTGTTVYNGGQEQVDSGGVASGTTISAGGAETVLRLHPADRGIALAAPSTLNRLELSNQQSESVSQAGA